MKRIPPGYSINRARLSAAYDQAISQARGTPQLVEPFRLPDFPPSVLNKLPEKARMAFDDAINSNLTWAAAAPFGAVNAAFAEGMEFLGYPYLSMLAQRPEYRVISETIAGEMTRKWIKFQASGDEESKVERIKQLTDEFTRLKVQDSFRRIAEYDGFMGRSHLYVDLGTDLDGDRDELKSSIGNGNDETTKAKFRKGSLKALRPVEAVWCYPTNYNSNDPLKADWYRPKHWFVMGREIHITRFLTFVGREVPDLLKPAYSFGGLSMSQIAKPYVDNWLKIRQSVADIVQAFSIVGLKTNLSETLNMAGDLLFKRMQLFNMTRNNKGMFMIDKDTEDFWNIAIPLGGLDSLQAQAQEHMAAISRIPLVKLLGIQPTGLNACLTGDTLIETNQGFLPIRSVRSGQKVMTRNGWAPIAKVGCTGYATELIEIETTRSLLRCTTDHRIWSPSINAFVLAKNVRHGDPLLYRGVTENQNTENQFPTGVGFGGIEGMGTMLLHPLIKGNLSFIGKFGAFIKAQFQKVSISTILIRIVQTINLAISKCFQTLIMQGCMASLMGFLFEKQLNTNVNVAIAGIGLPYRSQRELSFVVIGAGSPIGEVAAYQRLNRARSAFASFAAFVSKQKEKMLNTVLGNAQLRARTAPHTRLSITKSIQKSGLDTTNVETVIAVRRVPAQEFVFDIQVAPGYLPEFFANGVCVHNSSEGEIRTFYDSILEYQTSFFKPHLTTVMHFAMMNIWGEVDPEINFEFEPLWSLDEKAQAEVREIEARTGQVLIDDGTIDPAEERRRVASDPDTPYDGLDVNDVPDLKEEEEEGLVPKGGGGGVRAVLGEGEGEGETPESESAPDLEQHAPEPGGGGMKDLEQDADLGEEAPLELRDPLEVRRGRADKLGRLVSGKAAQPSPERMERAGKLGELLSKRSPDNPSPERSERAEKLGHLITGEPTEHPVRTDRIGKLAQLVKDEAAE